MGKSSSVYRLRYQTIARYVSFKLPKRLTRADKAKITRYHNRIGKALARGCKVVKAKGDGRIAKAHRAQGINGLPELKVALIKPTNGNGQITIGKGGQIRSVDRESGVSRVLIGARFFDAEEVEEGEPEAEAARLIAEAREALGHKPQRCAVAYWGGENTWAALEFLPELLVVNMSGYGPSGGYPADGINFYWVKRSRSLLKVQQRLRDERTRAAERRAERRRASDV